MSLHCDEHSHCEHGTCQKMADFSCDYAANDGRPCGRRLCAMHAHPVERNVDYCTKHSTEFKRQQEKETA